MILQDLEEKYYVYVWFKPDDTPFYVGKGTGDRWKRCGKTHRNKYFSRVYQKYPGCYSLIIEDHLNEETAFQREIEWISQQKALGFQLTNFSNGGEGKKPSVPRSEEYRERVRLAVTGNRNPNYGNRWTEQQKTHLSMVKKIRGSSKLGKNGRAKRVMCVESGKVYSCQKLAAEDLGLRDYTSVHHALKKPNYTAAGYHFVEGDLISQLDTAEKRNQYLSSIQS